MNNKNSKSKMAEQIWLLFFNQVLFEKGIITEAERNKMVLKIEQRDSSAGKDKGI